MKKTFTFAICIMAVLFISCEPYELGTSSKVKTDIASDITIESVVLHGVVNIDISKYNSVKCGIMISESNAEIVAREGEKFRAEELIGRNFKLQINGLSAKTKYYYCAYVYLNDIQYEYGEIKEFETSEPNLAEVITKEVTKFGLYSATVTGSVIDDCGASIIETGIVYSTSKEPKISDEKVVSGNNIGDFACKITGLQDNTTYYTCTYAINEVGVSYGNVITFSTMRREYENGREYIDLGLSVKWGTRNVGANKVEDYGDYFAWGETRPKSNYNWDTYKWCYEGLHNAITKYREEDNKTQLELSDDAARYNWGGRWRMPTVDEIEELRKECDWQWTTLNGVTGYKVTSLKNDNSIFLPAAGSYDETRHNSAGSWCEYWSSSCNISMHDYWNAYLLSISIYTDISIICSWRNEGCSVRPVCP